MSTAEVTDALPSVGPLSQPEPVVNDVRLSQADADELHARRVAEARLVARLHGWKPIVVWYSLWTVLLGIGAISGLSSGQVEPSLVTCGIAGLCAKYAHYLYNGGRRRVWFIIW
jgi:hypothetical protein